jgi:hypothetical protein
LGQPAAGIMQNPLIGNGVCNNETIKAECNYDGGDCK